MVSVDVAPIAWHAWCAGAFERAATEGKPILLAIGAAWCPWSAEMDRVTYADAGVAALIAARFVPIRVDADRRPDVSERYCLGGWPTTAFLTPAGALLGGATFLTPGELAPLLARTADAFSERRSVIEHETRRAAMPAANAPHPLPVSTSSEAKADSGAAAARAHTSALESDTDFEAWLCERMIDELDRAHGGFGDEPKLVYAEALRVAVARWREGGDARLAQVVTATLDAMADGPLWDAAHGGFSRYAEGRDWSRPHREKLLTTQAALLHLYLDAWQAFGRARDRAQAIGIVKFVHSTLADRSGGGFFASQQPDRDAASGRLRAFGASARLGPPAVDRSLYSDANGLMAAAYTHAGEALGDVSLIAFAAQSIDRVAVAAYERGRGIAHEAEGGSDVRGLLADQVHVAAALLDLHEAAGQAVHLDMAQELMLFALRHLWDRCAGGFVDHAPGGPDDVGLLRDPLRPFAASCEAAGTLARMARATGRTDFADRAAETLAALRLVARRHDLHAGPYALALREVKG